MLSDSILLSIIDDPYTLTIFQTYKGLAFVFFTSILLFLVVNREIYKQKRYELELKLAKENAERSDRLKTTFLNNMSHEIRTPMNCILGFSELLSSDDITEDDRSKYIKILNNNGNQLLRIIDDILDISKIEVGVVDIKKNEFSLNELFEEIEVFIKDILKNKEKSLDFNILNDARDTIDVIVGDRGRLVQILQNLITNAVKFTSEGSIEVKCFKRSDGFLIFHVRDTGIGIKEDKLEKIFEPFIQEEDTIVRSYGGTGLGLPISKALVEILGGEVGVRSIKGEGSDFFFTIPY